MSAGGILPHSWLYGLLGEAQSCVAHALPGCEGSQDTALLFWELHTELRNDRQQSKAALNGFYLN